jgi:hypothetical protein
MGGTRFGCFWSQLLICKLETWYEDRVEVARTMRKRKFVKQNNMRTYVANM